MTIVVTVPDVAAAINECTGTTSVEDLSKVMKVIETGYYFEIDAELISPVLETLEKNHEPRHSSRSDTR